MFESQSTVVVKVCGLTNVADAEICAANGVEMLGLNFSPQSPRCLSLEVAREIIAAIRPRFATQFVGVFVNHEIGFVETTARDLGLDAVQLHGNESPLYLRELRVPRIIKAFRVRETIPEFGDYDCAAILLDTWSAQAPGGTGETFSWKIAESFPRERCRLFLAGGLTSENVREAIRIVRPFAVDVCSGVEDRPGKKNRDKLLQFLEVCR